MPLGYYGTLTMAMVFNKRYQSLCTEELERRGLGPFAKEVAA